MAERRASSLSQWAGEQRLASSDPVGQPADNGETNERANRLGGIDDAENRASRFFKVVLPLRQRLQTVHQ